MQGAVGLSIVHGTWNIIFFLPDHAIQDPLDLEFLLTILSMSFLFRISFSFLKISNMWPRGRLLFWNSLTDIDNQNTKQMSQLCLWEVLWDKICIILLPNLVCFQQFQFVAGYGVFQDIWGLHVYVTNRSGFLYLATMNTATWK